MTFAVPGDVVAAEGEIVDEDVGLQDQLLRLAGWIDIESRLTVSLQANNQGCPNSHQIGCAGAVLSYLQRSRANIYLPGDAAAHRMFRISTMEMFSLRDTMYRLRLDINQTWC
jgi:DNA mismatch repair protein MSH5